MNNEHFEPVTAKTLAAKLHQMAIACYQRPNTSSNDTIAIMESIIDPHIRKPSDDDKSVPQRCAEAYYNAVDLMKKMYIKGMTSENKDELLVLIGKSDPFKEAEIVKDEKPEPQLLPFDLKLAQEGAKVVTHSGKTEVKIIADNISGPHPILATYNGRQGGMFFDQFGLDGCRKGINDENMNLFILKEPETVHINIFRKPDGSIYASSSNKHEVSHRFTFIKTIKAFL